MTTIVREVDLERSRYSPGIIAAIVILVVVVLVLLALTIYFGIKSSNNNTNTTSGSSGIIGPTGPQGPTGTTGPQGATGAGFNLGEGIRPFRFTHTFSLHQGAPHTYEIPLNQVFDNFTTIYEVTINTFSAFSGFNRRYVIPPSGPGVSLSIVNVPIRYDTFIRDNILFVNVHSYNNLEISPNQQLTLQLLAFSRPILY